MSQSLTMYKILKYRFFLFFSFIQIINSAKIVLFDSTRIKDDLNWSKVSFREQPFLPAEGRHISSKDWIRDKLSTINDKDNQFGWKESSFSLNDGEDVSRIHFVCDLNAQNIQNWLFTPLINTKLANRVTLNLTFTIRECEEFPIKQVVKNCREKFELYYEETPDSQEEANYLVENQVHNSTLFFLDKIKQLKFRDTFVSDTGLRYYNSVVDRQKKMNSQNILARPGDSISVELREIPLSPPQAHSTSTLTTSGENFIRFAIRDTGACISLLAVEVSYTTCAAFKKHGVSFPETSTGRDLTDLIQVNGKCPAYSSSTHIPKAICTAKGEWLITDQNLATRCQCLPGYEFLDEGCSTCSLGYYKASLSNEKCLPCPENSWSSRPGSSRCECLANYFRENDLDILSGCRVIQEIAPQNLNIEFVADDKINVTIDRVGLGLSKSIQTEFKCFQCSGINSNSKASQFKDECDINCYVTSISNDWIVISNKFAAQQLKLKMLIRQRVSERELIRSSIFIYLNQEKSLAWTQNKKNFKNVHLATEGHNTNPKQSKGNVLCAKLTKNIQKQLSVNYLYKNNNGMCLNVSVNLTAAMDSLYAHHDLMNKIKSAHLFQAKIYAIFTNNDYQLIPVATNSGFQLNSNNEVMVKLNSVDSVQIKSFIFNQSHYPILLCNLNEVDKLKIEFSFRNRFDPSNSNDGSTVGQLYDWKSLEVYTIDLKLDDVCNFKESDFDTLINYPLDLMTLVSFKNSPNLGALSANNPKNEPNQNSLKFNVFLPVLLSFVCVLFFILTAVIIRRYRVSGCAATKDRKYTCEKHLKKFMPVLTKNCQRKCISCSNTLSTNTSTTSSSSPSTTCTTSQIMEQNSKLYYVDPHTYEHPVLAIQEFAQEISPVDIKIESVIGGGEFGDVCKGKLKVGSHQWTTVAIKTLKVHTNEKSRCDFLTEASIMAQFHHENIINLEGVVTQSHPYMIITEYMDNGSLDQLLKLNAWRLNVCDLTKMLRDIANGMKYLAEMSFVHRDLAARNILVDKNLKCKVADFGLSRELEGTITEGAYWTKGGKIPVRWTAPEAISHTKFTCASDVWSFGVVAWEVMSFGERPYWNWSNTDVIKAVDKGFRLYIPQNCPEVLYNLILDCWNTDRQKRPRFKQIVTELDVLIKSKRESLYVLTKNEKQLLFIDVNKPNFTQLTSIQEWLNSLNMSDYVAQFVARKFLNLSQVLGFEKAELNAIKIYDENNQNLILESLKQIQFELNFQSGFLV